MKNHRNNLVFGLTSLLLLASSLVSVAAPKHTGIQGQASLTISYGIGVEVAPGVWVAPPSVSVPVIASFVVLSARTGHEVARVTTDGDGRYGLSLLPGRYLVVPNDITLPGGCPVSLDPIPVTVHARQFTPANLYYFRLGPCSVQAER